MTKIHAIDADTNEIIELDVPSATGTSSVEITGYAVPTGDPVVGQLVIAVTGTRIALSATAVELPSGTVLISALADNTDAGTVGGATVTNVVDGSGNGFILEAGDSVVVNADDLGDVYINGTAGDIFTFAAG